MKNIKYDHWQDIFLLESHLVRNNCFDTSGDSTELLAVEIRGGGERTAKQFSVSGSLIS